jgi:hypothetical protein
MIVIEAIMALYIKDILIADQVIDVVSRYHSLCSEDLPLTIEETALFWINKSASRLKQQADDELARFEHESLSYVPTVQEAQELAELGSGCLLLGLISFYCPDYINWTEICLKEQLTLEECMANLELLHYFCAKYLPYDICFLDIEDFLQLQNSMKINLLTFVADLMYLFEIKPANCVRRVMTDDNQSIDQPPTLSDDEIRLNENQCKNSSAAQLRPSRSQLLSASEMKARSLRHTSWTELEADEIAPENDPRLFQQQKLAKYFQPHQHLREEIHKPLSRSESTANTLHKARTLTKQASSGEGNGLNDLTHDLSSMRLDPTSENSFYLSHDVNSNHLHNNAVSNESAQSTSPISFAKLSKIKDIHGSPNAIDNAVSSATMSRPAINVAYSSNQLFDTLSGESDANKPMPTETELGGQIMEIRLKLEEKRRQIEMGRKKQEDNWKTQRQGIGKEAFLKALKKEKLNCSGSNSLLYTSAKINSVNDLCHLDPSEMKENLDHSKRIDTMKRSSDLPGQIANDLDGDDSMIDQQRKLRSQSFGQTTNGSNQFFLHSDDLSNEDAFFQTNNGHNSSSHLNKRFSDYISSAQQQQMQKLDSHMSTMKMNRANDSESAYPDDPNQNRAPVSHTTNGQNSSLDQQISSQNNKGNLIRVN